MPCLRSKPSPRLHANAAARMKAASRIGCRLMSACSAQQCRSSSAVTSMSCRGPSLAVASCSCCRRVSAACRSARNACSLAAASRFAPAASAWCLLASAACSPSCLEMQSSSLPHHIAASVVRQMASCYHNAVITLSLTPLICTQSEAAGVRGSSRPPQLTCATQPPGHWRRPGRPLLVTAAAPYRSAKPLPLQPRVEPHRAPLPHPPAHCSRCPAGQPVQSAAPAVPAVFRLLTLRLNPELNCYRTMDIICSSVTSCKCTTLLSLSCDICSAPCNFSH